MLHNSNCRSQAASSLRDHADQIGKAQAAAAAQQIDAGLRTATKVAVQPATLLETYPTLSYAQAVAYIGHLLQATPRADAYDAWIYSEHANYKSPSGQVWITRASYPKLMFNFSYDYHVDNAGSAWYNLPKVTHHLAFTEPYFDASGTNELFVTIFAPAMAGASYLGTTGVDIELTTCTSATGPTAASPSCIPHSAI